VAKIALTLSNRPIDRFSNFVHSQLLEKFAITMLLKIPRHLKCVATLRREMSVS